MYCPPLKHGDSAPSQIPIMSQDKIEVSQTQRCLISYKIKQGNLGNPHIQQARTTFK